MPAKAGIQTWPHMLPVLDARFRGNDSVEDLILKDAAH